MGVNTMNIRQIQIPDRMLHLPIAAGGFPIPYVILVDDEGIPHFKINEESKVQECLVKDLCAICGLKMENLSYMVMGKKCLTSMNLD